LLPPATTTASLTILHLLRLPYLPHLPHLLRLNQLWRKNWPFRVYFHPHHTAICNERSPTLVQQSICSRDCSRCTAGTNPVFAADCTHIEV
jgi:hypothetical protein